MKEKLTMSEYFDLGLERNALLLDASNLDWFEFRLFECIRKEIYKTLEDMNEDMDWGYSYPGGKKKLRELIAEHESCLEGVTFDIDDIVVVGNGVTGTLNFIAQILKKKVGQGTILVPVPTYLSGIKAFQYYNFNIKKVLTCRENNYTITAKEIKENYDESVIAIVITSPGNPACNYIEDAELEEIIEFAINKNIYIIADAIFEEAPNKEQHFQHFFIKAHEYSKLIKVKGFSKDAPHLADLRLGWAICKDKEVSKELIYLDEIMNFSNSTFLESLGIVDMQHRVWIDKNVHNDSVEKYIEERNYYHRRIFDTMETVICFLKKQHIIVDCIIPDAGNIVFFQVSDNVREKLNIQTSHDLFVWILENTNILVSPGIVFGLPEEELWCRITISRSEKQLMEGLMKIVDTIEGKMYD